MTPNERLVEVHTRGWRVSDAGIALKPDGSPQPVTPDKHGYLRFSVKHSDGEIRAIYTHRLQAYQKFGEKLFEPGTEVRHLNGELDNSAQHIEIGTKSQNELDKPLETRAAFAAGAGGAARKLSDAQVAQLRQDRVAGASYKQLAEKYGIQKSTISYIVNNKTCKAAS